MADNLSNEENNARFVNYPYDLRRDWWNDLQVRKLERVAKCVRPGETVLDVGCNSGYMVDFLPKTCEVHGVDLSPELVEKAKARLVSAQVAGAHNLPFPDKSFDVVLFLGVIEYVFDPEAVMKELARVARRAIIIEANHEDGVWGKKRVEGGHPYMVRGYDEPRLRALCETVGHVTQVAVIFGFGANQHRIAEVTL